MYKRDYGYNRVWGVGDGARRATARVRAALWLKACFGRNPEVRPNVGGSSETKGPFPIHQGRCCVSLAPRGALR